MKFNKEFGASLLIEKIKQKYLDLKIGLRIALFYFLVLIFSLSVSSYLYQKIYINIAQNKISEVSVQTLYSIKSNIDSLFNNINNNSKMILSDTDLQSLLRNGNVYSDLNTQSRVGLYLYRIIQAAPAISSVYIFDMSGNSYAVSEKNPVSFVLKSVKDAAWYDQVIKMRGAYLLKLNGGGAFAQDKTGNYISMIRLIRDLDNTRNLGILVINISDRAFKEAYANITQNYKTSITLWDENNEDIIRFDGSGDESTAITRPIIDKAEIESLLSKSGDSENGYVSKKINKTEYLISYVKESKFKWKIVSIMPFTEVSNDTATMGLVGFVTILLNSILLFLGSIFISRLITVPIKKLLKSMNEVKNGVFKEVNINEGNNEIGQLRDGYNVMIREIQNLIKSVIAEQRTIRKAELNVLQAQIKPHFLYNSLDSINSLALSGRIDDVCDLVDALGSYYRASVSKGKEVISLREEFDIVKNYLKIQKIRYGDMFSVEYNIDEKYLDNKILKLVLQPLVENALYHGIRATGESGSIFVSSEEYDGYIKICIEDDGVGMTSEEINGILSSKVGSAESSFGLRGTIERLRIFYGDEDIFHIQSEKGKGTKITIMIPIDENIQC